MDSDHSQSEEDNMELSDDAVDDNSLMRSKRTTAASSDRLSASDVEVEEDDDAANMAVVPGASAPGRRKTVVGDDSDMDEQIDSDDAPDENEENEENEGEDMDAQEIDEASSRASSPQRSPTPQRPEVMPAAPPSKKPSFRIKLKLPTAPSAASTRTPSDETPQPSSRRRLSRDIESEDEDEDEDSASAAGPSRMTHRQAALAGVVERTELVSLDESSKKKKFLNEAELALKREETARKRKNLSEKKLADEKAETINRLLKKQSRARNKRSALATADPDEEADPDSIDVASDPQSTALPIFYRWISSSKEGMPALSLSIPTVVLEDDHRDEVRGTQRITKTCSVVGCGQPLKYKIVSDPSIGGCGLEHWRALQVK